MRLSAMLKSGRRKQECSTGRIAPENHPPPVGFLDSIPERLIADIRTTHNGRGILKFV
jgi:hypothetical protein